MTLETLEQFLDPFKDWMEAQRGICTTSPVAIAFGDGLFNPTILWQIWVSPVDTILAYPALIFGCLRQNIPFTFFEEAKLL